VWNWVRRLNGVRITTVASATGRSRSSSTTPASWILGATTTTISLCIGMVEASTVAPSTVAYAGSVLTIVAVAPEAGSEKLPSARLMPIAALVSSLADAAGA
jgi:hypothetical protein